MNADEKKVRDVGRKIKMEEESEGLEKRRQGREPLTPPHPQEPELK